MYNNAAYVRPVPCARRARECTVEGPTINSPILWLTTPQFSPQWPLLTAFPLLIRGECHNTGTTLPILAPSLSTPSLHHHPPEHRLRQAQILS